MCRVIPPRPWVASIAAMSLLACTAAPADGEPASGESSGAPDDPAVSDDGGGGPGGGGPGGGGAEAGPGGGGSEGGSGGPGSTGDGISAGNSEGGSSDGGDGESSIGGSDDGPAPLDHPAPGTWIAIEPGSFSMGADPDDPCPINSGNDIQHDATLTGAFEISATEVTYGEYAAATGSAHPWEDGCDDCPVQMVTWHDAAAICNAYSDYAGLPSCYACETSDGGLRCEPSLSAYDCDGYRLPTEAEWEYAARAGTTTAVYAGQMSICNTSDPLLDTISWYLFHADGDTHPVATLLPNDWGLYDTSGNVWEWTHDSYVQDLSSLPEIDPVVDDSIGGTRVMRGGSYNCLPSEVRVAHRSGLPDVIAGLNVGLRCARSLD